MSSRVNEVNGENLQDPPIKNPGYANEYYKVDYWSNSPMRYRLNYRVSMQVTDDYRYTTDSSVSNQTVMYHRVQVSLEAGTVC